MLHTMGKSRRVSVCDIIENWTLFIRFRLTFPLMTVIHTSFCCTVKNYKLSKIFWHIRAHLRYCAASKDALENCQTTANDDIITDILHNACSLSRHQSQQYGSWEDTKGQIQSELWMTIIQLKLSETIFQPIFLLLIYGEYWKANFWPSLPFVFFYHHA